MNQSNPVDSIGLFILLATWIFSAEVAAVIGPYVAIIVGAACGAALSLGSRQKTTRMGAIGYFVVVCTLATLVASSIAAIMAWAHPGLSERALLVPVAIGIGWIGDDWKAIRQNVADFVRDFVFRKRGEDR